MFIWNFYRINTVNFPLLLAGLLVVFAMDPTCYFSSTYAKSREEALPSVTVSVKNMPISQVAVLIQEQIGYQVVLKSISPDVRVAGQFTNTDIETVFTSLLKGNNIAILVDNKDRLVTVQSLGKKTKNDISVGNIERNVPVEIIDDQGHNIEGGSSQSLKGESSYNNYDPFTGQTQKEIGCLHVEQEFSIEREEMDPSNVEPFTGMTNAEISELHNMQNKEIESSHP